MFFLSTVIVRSGLPGLTAKRAFGSEAVNFALPDWLPLGLQCVQRYQELKKVPVFSHDELLLTIFSHEKNPRTSRWCVYRFTSSRLLVAE